MIPTQEELVKKLLSQDNSVWPPESQDKVNDLVSDLDSKR